MRLKKKDISRYCKI